MSFRTLILPAALIAALFAIDTQTADAHGRRLGPHGRRLHHHRGGVVVGANVAIPIRQRGGYYREVVEYVGGFYETRTREVEVPGRQIGWTMKGKPMFGPSRVETESYEVWVPRERVVKRVWVPARRRVGTVAVGARWRVR